MSCLNLLCAYAITKSLVDLFATAYIEIFRGQTNGKSNEIQDSKLSRFIYLI